MYDLDVFKYIEKKFGSKESLPLNPKWAKLFGVKSSKCPRWKKNQTLRSKDN